MRPYLNGMSTESVTPLNFEPPHYQTQLALSPITYKPVGQSSQYKGRLRTEVEPCNAPLCKANKLYFVLVMKLCTIASQVFLCNVSYVCRCCSLIPTLPY